MRLTLVFLAGLVWAASGQTTCPSTFDDKIDLIAQDNDRNNDGQVTTGDIREDSVYYDPNSDGRVTETECVNRWSSRYCDTRYLAAFFCAVFSSGKAISTMADFSGPPYDTGVPLDDFKLGERQRYALFQNRSCIDRELTLDEKLALILADNDHDNDSFVTTDDFQFDMGTNYDTDRDGVVTQFEWVLRWVCAYGDSGDYARFVWRDLGSGPNDTVTVSDLQAPQPIPVAAFTERNRQRYERYEAEQQGGVGK